MNLKLTDHINPTKTLWSIGLVMVMAHLWPLAGAQLGQKLWDFQAGGGISSPAIGTDGTLYVGSSDGRVYALNGATGQKLWDSLPRGGMSSPAIGADGTVYVGSGDNNVYALSGTTGQEVWEFAAAPWVSAGPAIAVDGTIYIGSGRAADNNNIYALSGATGQKRWEFQAGLGENALSSPAIAADGTVYVGAVGTAYALHGETGQRLWDFLTGGFVESSPAIGAGGTVYVGSDDGKVYALNGATGQKVWDFLTGDVIEPRGVESSPAIGADETVYVGSADGKVYALNGATGQKVWEFRTGGPVFSSPAIAADGTVYVGSNDGKVYALNGGTGQELWDFETGGPVGLSSPAIGSDGTVYVGSSDGKIYALQGSSRLAQSPWPKFRHDALNTGQATGQPGIERQPSLAVLKEDQDGRIAVRVSGVPVPKVQWFFNGAVVAGGTQAVLSLPPVTRALEGTYWLVASNALGQATSAPIAAVVSNADPDRFVGLHWQGRADSGLGLESTDLLGAAAVWHSLSNFPPSATEQRYVELGAAPVGFYRLNGPAPPAILTAGYVNGLRFDAPVGTQVRIEQTSASAGWTNWLILTNLVLPAKPFLFLDYESLDEAQRVYRTTPMP